MPANSFYSGLNPRRCGLEQNSAHGSRARPATGSTAWDVSLHGWPKLTDFCAKETDDGGRGVAQAELVGEHDVRSDGRPDAQIWGGGQDDCLAQRGGDGDG